MLIAISTGRLIALCSLLVMSRPAMAQDSVCPPQAALLDGPAILKTHFYVPASPLNTRVRLGVSFGNVTCDRSSLSRNGWAFYKYANRRNITAACKLPYGCGTSQFLCKLSVPYVRGVKDGAVVSVWHNATSDIILSPSNCSNYKASGTHCSHSLTSGENRCNDAGGCRKMTSFSGVKCPAVHYPDEKWSMSIVSCGCLPSSFSEKPVTKCPLRDTLEKLSGASDARSALASLGEVLWRLSCNGLGGPETVSRCNLKLAPSLAEFVDTDCVGAAEERSLSSECDFLPDCEKEAAVCPKGWQTLCAILALESHPAIGILCVAYSEWVCGELHDKCLAARATRSCDVEPTQQPTEPHFICPPEHVVVSCELCPSGNPYCHYCENPRGGWEEWCQSQEISIRVSCSQSSEQCLNCHACHYQTTPCQCRAKLFPSCQYVNLCS